MRITLNSPDLERFVEDQVKSGQYPSAEAVVEAAIADLRASGQTDLDDETIAAINEAEAQADRGEGMDLDAFRAQMNRRMDGH